VGLILQNDLLLIGLCILSLLEMQSLDELLQNVHVLVEQVEKDVLCEVILDEWVHLLAEEMLDNFEEHGEGLFRQCIALELSFLHCSEEGNEELEATLTNKGLAELGTLRLLKLLIFFGGCACHAEWALSNQIVQ
jgi:hypothetical protein